MDRRRFLALGGAALAAASVGGDAAVFAQTPFSQRTPRRADELCDSYCVNTKFFYGSTVYGFTDEVVSLVRELGARIVRERLLPTGSTAASIQRRAMLELADTGTRWHATVGTLDQWPQAEVAHREIIDTLATSYAPEFGGDLTQLLHSLGGCNEVDGSGPTGTRDPGWAVHARHMQLNLWDTATSSTLTRDIPVAGPSTRSDVTAERIAELGDLSAWCDRFGNAHLYNRGRSPSRGIDEHLDLLEPCFTDAKLWIFSETGYNNSPQDNAARTVSEETSATYAIRGICDYFQRNAIYGRFELLDDPDPIDTTSQQTINTSADLEAHFGLVAMTEDDVAAATPDTWRKKPEFFATQRFLALLADPGPSFATHSLVMRINTLADDVQHLLLEKRDGRMYVVVWRDVDIATTFPDARALPVNAARVDVEFLDARPVAVYEPGLSAKPVFTTPRTTSVTLAVSGELTVVEVG